MPLRAEAVEPDSLGLALAADYAVVRSVLEVLVPELVSPLDLEFVHAPFFLLAIDVAGGDEQTLMTRLFLQRRVSYWRFVLPSFVDVNDWIGPAMEGRMALERTRADLHKLTGPVPEVDL